MNTSSTASKVSLKPLKGMKTFVQKGVDTVETEGLDRIGFFDEEQKPACFDANGKGQLIFSSPRTEVPEVFQKAFENDNPSKLDPGIATELFKDGGYKVLGAVQTGVDALGGIAKQTGDALSDLVKITVGQTEKPTEVPQDFQKAFEGEDPSKLDPAVAKKQEEAKEYSVIKEAEEVLDKAQADYRGKELFEKAVMSKKAEIADLANLQGNYRGVLDEKGETSTHLQTAIAQAREKILKDQQAKQGPFVSASKKPEGPGMSMNAIDDGEKHGQTAGTSTG